MPNILGGDYTSPEFEKFMDFLLWEDYPPTMTAKNLAARLHISRNTIAGWCRKGFVDFHKHKRELVLELID